MAVNNSDTEIIFQNTGSSIGRFVKALGLLYFLDFISLSNKSFKSLTCVGKFQCCLECILFQRFDIYLCFLTLNVHPSSVKCKKLPVSFLWEKGWGKRKTMNTYFVRKSGS